MRLDQKTRSDVWEQVRSISERYFAEVDSLPVSRIPTVGELQSILKWFDFEEPADPREVLRHVTDAMTAFQTHTAHRRYFGLFNPAPSDMGIIGEALSATFNTQMAAWSHAPFANDVERHLVGTLGSQFDETFKYGCFTSGGAEANLTAMLCALASAYPNYATDGLRSLNHSPVVYVSSAAHHSFVKATRACGLGTSALRVVPCGASLGMDVGSLEAMIRLDRANGLAPFLIIATAGATVTGIVEDLSAIGDVASREDAWFHVDAAWGGFAAFIPELRNTLSGIALADSITFDPHKMLSVPMGAGLFLTKSPDATARAFSVSANYMPSLAGEDPFSHSLQWSRRFIGLKLLLTLAVEGWDGYARILRRQVELGLKLRAKLIDAGWLMLNHTPFPLVCFTHAALGTSPSEFAARVQKRGNVWISSAALPDETSTLRACITNFQTTEEDLDALVREVDLVRCEPRN